MSTNLPRVHQKIFGELAATTNPKRIAQFGSVVAGAPNLTGDIETIQALSNWEQGWVGSTVTDRRYPTAEETTGVNKVFSQQLAYIFQKGIPEWCEDVTYFANTGFCQRNGVLYQSLTNNNIGNDPALDTVNWQEALAFTGANIDLSNLSNVGKDYINQSKALETGSISINADVYTWIKSMKDNSFDKSKFTITGSPTISNNGIATLTPGNTISISNIPINGESFDITISFTLTGTSTSPTVFNFGGISLYQGSNSGAMFLAFSNSITASGQYEYLNYSGFTLNVPILFNFSFNATTKVMTVNPSQNGVIINPDAGSSNTHTLISTFGDSNLSFGFGNNSTAIAGTYDLKPVSINVDNTEVFSGKKTGSDTVTIGGSSVTIPYIVSKTGSKIADVAYRTNIQNLYAQEGLAEYFTIDETNQDFTLPMGDIYGMIERLRKLLDDFIGVPIPTFSNTLDEGEIWLEGAEVSKSTYDVLYSIYGNNFGTPLDNNNFVLPNIVGRTLQGIDGSGTFGYLEAALPNIKGAFWGSFGFVHNTSGAFSGATTQPDWNGGGADWCINNIQFSAHDSSAIYQDDATVQPPAIKVRFKTRYK